MQRLWTPILVIAAALTSGTAPRGIAWGQVNAAGKQAAGERHVLCGIVHKVNGSKFTLETRAGKTVQVDAASAIQAEKSATVYEGVAVSADGTMDKSGVLQATSVNRIKSARAMWPEDR